MSLSYLFGKSKTNVDDTSSDDGVLVDNKTLQTPKKVKKIVENLSLCKCDSLNPNECPSKDTHVNGQHKCVCDMIGPIWCRYVPATESDQKYYQDNRRADPHTCMCEHNPDWVKYCKSDAHKCVCNETINRTMLGLKNIECYTICRAGDGNHECRCDKYNCKSSEDNCKANENEHFCVCIGKERSAGIKDNDCKAIKHNVKCICDIVGSDMCISDTHDCICSDEYNDNDTCISTEHDCICSVDYLKCKTLYHHSCICYKDSDNCRVAANNHSIPYIYAGSLWLWLVGVIGPIFNIDFRSLLFGVVEDDESEAEDETEAEAEDETKEEESKKEA